MYTTHTTPACKSFISIKHCLDNISFSSSVLCTVASLQYPCTRADTTMKSDLSFVTGLCLLLAPAVKTDQLKIENSFLEARLHSLNGTYKTGSLEMPWDPIVDLLFQFITPYGPGVSQKCSDSSLAYKDALNNVS